MSHDPRLARLAIVAACCWAPLPSCAPSPAAPTHGAPFESKTPTLQRLAGQWGRPAAGDQDASVSMLIDEGGAFSWLEDRKGSLCRFAGKVTVEPGGDGLGYLSIRLSLDTCREQLVYRSFKILSLSGDAATISEDRETGGDGKPQGFRRAAPPATREAGSAGGRENDHAAGGR